MFKRTVSRDSDCTICDSGVELAKAYFKAYRSAASDDGKVFDIVFLQNHGLVVSAESAEAVIDKTEYVLCF